MNNRIESIGKIEFRTLFVQIIRKSIIPIFTLLLFFSCSSI